MQWWGIGNEMYGKLATRPHAAGKVRRQAQPVRRRRCGPPIRRSSWSPWATPGRGAKACSSTAPSRWTSSASISTAAAKKDLAAHVRQIPDAVRGKAAAHRRYRESSTPSRARTSASPWTNGTTGTVPDVFGEIGTRYLSADALGIAAGLNEYFPAKRHDLHGQLRPDRQRASAASRPARRPPPSRPPGLVLKLYRRALRHAAGGRHGRRAPWTSPPPGRPTARRLTVSIVNPTLQKLDLPLKLKGTG